MKLLCEVYRCSKKEGMYLYVAKDDGFERLPEGLKGSIGNTELALTLVLTPEKKLAQADVSKVLNEIEQKGYYLQLPKVDY